MKHSSFLRITLIAVAGGGLAAFIAREALGDSPLSARNCGQPESGCAILAEGIASPRSLSKVQADGSFFVGSAGSPANDLFAEAVAGTDIDSSTIFRYTESGGLQPWVTSRPSQLITVINPNVGGLGPYQSGINGVEVMGGDLIYSLSYNRGTTNYVDRMRSFTVETGISFGEVRRISGGVRNPNGPETVIADLGRAEAENNNPDDFLFPFDNLDHKTGDPELATNPYGLLARGNQVFVVDAAGNDLYRIRKDRKLDLLLVFNNSVSADQPVPTNLLESPDSKLYATLFFCVNLFEPGALGAIVEIKPNSTIQAVSFHSLPISVTVGPDGFLYVLEYANLFSPQSGRVLKTTPQEYNDFNGRPVSDGTVVIDNLNFPVDLEFDNQGRLVVLESAELDPFETNGRIIRFHLPEGAATGE